MRPDSQVIQYLRVTNLKEGPNPVQTRIPPDVLEVKPYHGLVVVLVGDVAIDFSAYRKQDQVYLSGKVDFTARLVCADCAVEFEHAFSEKVNVEYERGIPPGRDLPKVHELGEDEMGRTYYEGDEIDLFPLIRDTILLAIPIAPLCRPDCKGICPECGANLNLETHACSPGVG